jgi:hypothetical protein
MRALTFTLFVVGLLVSLTSVAANRVTSIPFVLRLFAPAYYGANIARQQLESARELAPSDRGFREVAQLVMNNLRKANSADKLSGGVSIIHFSLGTAVLGFSTTHTREAIPFEIQLSTGETVRAELSQLDQVMAAQRESATFRYRLIAFLVGTAAEAVGFFLEFFRRREQRI